MNCIFKLAIMSRIDGYLISPLPCLSKIRTIWVETACFWFLRRSPPSKVSPAYPLHHLIWCVQPNIWYIRPHRPVLNPFSLPFCYSPLPSHFRLLLVVLQSLSASNNPITCQATDASHHFSVSELHIRSWMLRSTLRDENPVLTQTCTQPHTMQMKCERSASIG